MRHESRRVLRAFLCWQPKILAGRRIRCDVRTRRRKHRKTRKSRVNRVTRNPDCTRVTELPRAPRGDQTVVSRRPDHNQYYYSQRSLASVTLQCLAATSPRPWSPSCANASTRPVVAPTSARATSSPSYVKNSIPRSVDPVCAPRDDQRQ